MKEINKIRFIYDEEDSPIKEYLRVFFEYIGLLTCSEKMSGGMKNGYIHRGPLSKFNDKDGIDIVINYYIEDTELTSNDRFSSMYVNDTLAGDNRIFMYVNMEEKTCEISKYPLTKSNNSKGKITLSSKRDTRIKILDSLINEIWKDDEKNKKAINEIRELYVPQNEDRDMFYILELYEQMEIVRTSFWIKDYKNLMSDHKNAFDEMIITDEIEMLLHSLFRMNIMLKEKNDPYSLYIKIQNLIVIEQIKNKIFNWEIKTMTNILDCYQQNFDIKSDIENLLKKLSKDYTWFIKSKFKSIELDNINEYIRNLDIGLVEKLIDESKNSNFPAYYQYVYDLKNKYMKGHFEMFHGGEKLYKNYIEKFLSTFSHECDVRYDAEYIYARMITADGESEFAKLLFDKLQNNISSSNNTTYKLSLKKLFYLFQIYHEKTKISYCRREEYSGKGNYRMMYLLSYAFVMGCNMFDIVDQNENAFNDVFGEDKRTYVRFIIYNGLEWFNGANLGDEIVRRLVGEKVRKYVRGSKS